MVVLTCNNYIDCSRVIFKNQFRRSCSINPLRSQWKRFEDTYDGFSLVGSELVNTKNLTHPFRNHDGTDYRPISNCMNFIDSKQNSKRIICERALRDRHRKRLSRNVNEKLLRCHVYTTKNRP